MIFLSFTIDKFMIIVYTIYRMKFLTRTSLYELSMEGRMLVLRKKGLKKGESSKVKIGEEFRGDRLEILSGRAVLSLKDEVVLSTSSIQI